MAWLKQELPAWRDRGWISDEGAAALRAHYGDASGFDVRHLTIVLFGVAAALLIGGGVILLFAHNWEELSRPVRAVVSVTPLLATYAAAAYALGSGRAMVWRESVATANLCALAAAVGLVGQTYNIQGDLSSFLLTVALLGLPMIYLFESAAGAALFLAAATWRRWEAADMWHRNAGDWEPAWLVFLLMLASLVPLLLVYWRSGRTGPVRWLALGTLLALAVGMYPKGIDGAGVLMSLSLLASIVVGLSALDVERRILPRLAFALAADALWVLLLVASYSDFWEHASLYDETGAPTFALLATLAAASACVAFPAFRRRKFPVALWSALGLALLLMWTLLSGVDWILGAFATNALAVLLGAATLAFGFRQGRILTVNAGLVTIGGVLVLRFFDSDLPMVFRGLSFIVIGLAFVLVNVKLSRRIRQEAAQ